MLSTLQVREHCCRDSRVSGGDEGYGGAVRDCKGDCKGALGAMKAMWAMSRSDHHTLLPHSTP